MDYEDYEYLYESEEMDVKMEPHNITEIEYIIDEQSTPIPVEQEISSQEVDYGIEDLFFKIQHLQTKFEDLEEKIDQKYRSLERKQENNFNMIMTKLNWIQKNMMLEKQKQQAVISPPRNPSPPPPLQEDEYVPVSPAVSTPQDKSIIPLKLRGGPRSTSIKNTKVVRTTALRGITNYKTPKVVVNRLLSSATSDLNTKKASPSFDFVAIHEPIKNNDSIRKSSSAGEVKRVSEAAGVPKAKAEMIPNQFDPARILKSKPLLKTMNDMVYFERYLQIATYRAEILKNLKRLGGSSMQVEIMNMMRTLLSNVVQAHYTYQGQRKGKENFSMTMTWDLIRECIQTRYPDSTIEQVRKVVMDMLKNAPARIKLSEFKNTN